MRTIVALTAATLAATGATAIAQGRLCVLAVDDAGARVPLAPIVVTPADARTAATLPPSVSFAERERARAWVAGSSPTDLRACSAPPLRLVTYTNGRACVGMVGTARLTADHADASVTIADGETIEVRMIVAAAPAREAASAPTMQCGELRTETFGAAARWFTPLAPPPPPPMDLPSSVRTIITDRDLRSLPRR